MVDKKKLIKIRNISIGAIIGITIGGVGTNLLEGITSSGIINIPFIIDEIPVYPITKQEFYIDSISENDNIIREKEPTKSNMTKGDILMLNDAEINITEPYKERFDTEWRTYVTDLEYVKETTTYAFKSLTEDEKEEKIKNFKEGNIELAVENYDTLSETEEEIIYLTKEELENNTYSASLIINNIDYKNKKMTDESESYNIVYSAAYSVTSVSVGIFGGLFAYIIGEKDKKNVKKKIK